MATEKSVYLGFVEAVTLHIELMRSAGETRYGVFDRALVDSALARPRQAAVYADADLNAQAATLCFGLIKNHPWVGGNKRTATYVTFTFLLLNGVELTATTGQLIEMVLAVEADRMTVEQVAEWMRAHTRPMNE